MTVRSIFGSWLLGVQPRFDKKIMLVRLYFTSRQMAARNRSINIKFPLKNLVKTQKLAKTVELGLRDNTIRVSLEIKAKICHLFFTPKPTAEAVGFGLSLTRDRMAQQHRGTLKVESEMRVSTKFIITLPKL